MITRNASIGRMLTYTSLLSDFHGPIICNQSTWKGLNAFPAVVSEWKGSQHLRTAIHIIEYWPLMSAKTWPWGSLYQFNLHETAIFYNHLERQKHISAMMIEWPHRRKLIDDRFIHWNHPCAFWIWFDGCLQLRMLRVYSHRMAFTSIITLLHL